MEYEKFINPKVIKIGEREFAVSSIPAIDALPIYNVVSKAVADSGLIGLTMLPPECDKRLLGYTALLEGGMKIVPNTDTLINDIFKGSIGDIKKLVLEVVKENFSFLTSGDLLDALAGLGEATASGS